MTWKQSSGEFSQQDFWHPKSEMYLALLISVWWSPLNIDKRGVCHTLQALGAFAGQVFSQNMSDSALWLKQTSQKNALLLGESNTPWDVARGLVRMAAPHQSTPPCKYVSTHTSLGVYRHRPLQHSLVSKSHILWPREPWGKQRWCISQLAASFELTPGTGPCMPRSNTTMCIHLREGLLIRANQSKIFLQYKRKSQVILDSPEPFRAADQLLSSAGQASGQERQGAHYKFTFKERKKPFPMTALCSKAKRMRKRSITRHHRKIHIFLLSLWFLIWGVEGCFVLVGLFGFFWFVFGASFVIFKAVLH